MRYGGRDGKSEYLYIYGANGTTVMHPIRTEWIGRNMVDQVRDGKGRYTLKDILAIAGASGAGFVDTSLSAPRLHGAGRQAAVRGQLRPVELGDRHRRVCR